MLGRGTHEREKARTRSRGREGAREIEGAKGRARERGHESARENWRIVLKKAKSAGRSDKRTGTGAERAASKGKKGVDSNCGLQLTGIGSARHGDTEVADP